MMNTKRMCENDLRDLYARLCDRQVETEMGCRNYKNQKKFGGAKLKPKTYGSVKIAGMRRSIRRMSSDDSN